MAKKKRYTLEEVTKMMNNKYGKRAPYINRTMNYESDMRYCVNISYYQTLSQIVDAYRLED